MKVGLAERLHSGGSSEDNFQRIFDGKGCDRAHIALPSEEQALRRRANSVRPRGGSRPVETLLEFRKLLPPTISRM
jgi:hypothetical protein